MRAIKKIVALATGATMLGATITGAMAADLANYPAPFVEGCSFSGALIVGEKAAAEDVVGAVDIASSLAVSGTATGGTVGGGGVAVEGDAWLVHTSSKDLEINEDVQDVEDEISAGELNALADGELTNQKGTFGYEQFIAFSSSNQKVVFDEDDDDNVGLFFYTKSDEVVGTYSLEFTENMESDVDTSDSKTLEDFEDEELVISGKSFTITDAEITSGTKIKMDLMGGAVRDVLEQGAVKTYNVNGKDYEVEVTYIGETGGVSKVKFKVNGEVTDAMDESDTETLADGTEIGIREILEEEAGEVAADQVEFYLGAEKMTLEDTNIGDSLSSTALDVNEETIEDAAVIIKGSNTSASEIEVSDIIINVTADDDFWVPEGGVLTDQMDEPQALINWDFRFEGLTTEPTNDISIDARGDDQYDLVFTNAKGQEIKMPLAFGGTNNQVWLGEEDDRLILNPYDDAVADDFYFILNNVESNEADTTTDVIQYKGSDKASDTNPKIRFKILGTGETIERTWDVDTNTSDLKISGETYTFSNATMPNAKNFNITLTSGGSDKTVNLSSFGNATRTGTQVSIYTEYGARINISDLNESIVLVAGPEPLGAPKANDLSISVETIDDDLVDTLTVPYIFVNYSITASGDEVGLSRNSGFITMEENPDDDDEDYGYSNYGAWVSEKDVSGSNTPEEVDITYPQTQRFAQLFVTSGEVTATQIGGGVGEAVCKVTVPPAKLDSEVADVGTQNALLVGGPCANTKAAEALGVPSTVPECLEGFEEGKAKVKLMDTGAGNVAMLVAGYSAADTRRATTVVANYGDYALSGDEVEVVGTSMTDISVLAPTATTTTNTSA